MAGKVFEIAFNIMGRMGSSFNQSFASASDRMTQLNTRVSSLKAEMKSLDTQQKKGKISTEQYAAAYEKLSVQMAKAEKVQQRYAKSYALQNKVSTARSNARVNMAGTIETAAVVGTPVYSAMNFESAMAGVAKQVDGARDDTGKLTEVYYQAQGQVMQASKDMLIMPDNMAKAFAMAAKSGVQGMQNIDKFARMGIMMGTAFEEPAEQVTEDFAKIGSAMGIDLKTEQGIGELEALADTVNYLDDRSNAAGGDIIQVLKRISGTATSLLPTMSRTTLAGMSTAMLQMGETGETAGTALNALFTRVAAAPTQSKKFHGALAELGLSAEELQSGALRDAEGTIMNLFERIGGLDAATRNNVLAELFGAEHIDNLSKISGNYDEFLRVIKMGNSDEAKGSMAKEFAIQSQTTARQMEGLQAAAVRAAVGFSAVLLPDIQAIVKVVGQAADWFTQLGKEHDNVTGTVVRLGAAILGGTVALSAMVYVGWAVISPLANMYAWMSRVQLMTKLWTGAQWLWNAAMTTGRILLSIGGMVLYGAWMGICAAKTAIWTAAQWAWNAAMTANPIGLIIVGIGALIAAGYYLVQNWDTVKNFFIDMWNSPAAGLLIFVTGPVGWLIAAGYSIITNWQTVKTWFATLWDNPTVALQQFVDGIYSRFSKAFDWLGEKSAWVRNLFNGEEKNTGANTLSTSLGGIAQNANGGIYGKGAFLTTFAEKGPEAAIPLDGSQRAMSLWATAGQMMGFGGDSLFQNFADTPVSSGGGNTFVFSPNVTLDGGDPEAESKVRQVIREEADDFESRMDAWAEQQRRLSYA